MIRIGRLRFRTKVTLHTMLTACIALAMVGVSIVGYDRIHTRQAIESGMLFDADNIASASTAALQFDDRSTLGENLEAIKHQPHVEVAGIYDDENRLVASYGRKDMAPPVRLPAVQGVTYTANHLLVVRPVTLAAPGESEPGQVVGHVYIRRDLSDLRERLWQYLGIVTLVLGAALVITLVTTRFFTLVLTRPIGELVDTAARVTETQDYALRANKLSDDELGRLTDAFNQMLAQIQQRDAVVRDREHRFTTYMDNSTAVAWMKDEKYRYVYMNETFEKRFEIRFADCWGKTDYELFPAAVADSLREHDQTVFETNKTLETEETVPTPDGRTRIWLVIKFPFTDENDRLYVGGMAFEVTERVEVQRKLAHSEELYRSLVDLAPLAIFRKDLDGRMTFANPRCYEMMRMTPEQALGKTDLELFPEEFAERFFADDQHVIKTGETIEHDEEFPGEDGVRYMHTIKSPLHDPLGRVIGVQGLAWDITERIQAEAALRQSEQNLATAQQIAHIGSWTWNPHTGRVTLSDELYRIYGIVPDQFDGTFEYLLDHVVHPDDRQSLIDSSAAGARGEATPLEFRVVHPDGTLRIVIGEGETVLDPDGQIMELVGTVQDITDQKRAQDALQQSEEKYRRIVETAQEGIWVLDADALTSFINPRMAEMLGYTVEEMIGRSMYDYMSDAARVEAESNWQKRKSGLRETHEFCFRHRDGHDVWTLLSANPLTNDAGEFVGALGMVTDVTEQRQAEAAVKELEERLHTIVANTPIVLFATDRHGQFMLSEGQGLDVLGLEPGEVVGRSVFELYGDYPEVIECINRAMSGEAHTAVNAIGKVYFETQYSPLFDARGEVSGVIGVAINITDRLQAEVALRQSEQLNRSIVENVPGGIVRVDTDGSILHANTEAQSFLGLSLDELSHRYTSDWDAETVHEDGSPCSAADYPVTRCLSSGEPAPPMTIGVRRPDGTIRWAIFSAVPLFDPQSHKLNGAVVTFLDITDRKRTEEELQYHVEFERLITSISTDLLNLEPELIDNAVHDALRRIGRFVGVDRCYILVYDAKYRRWLVNSMYQWVDTEHGVDAPMQDALSVDDVPWASEQSLTGHVIQVRSPDQLPPEAAPEKARWLEQSIVSLISVPIFSAGSVYGVLAMETISRERELSEDVLTLLQIAGENLANALHRKQTEQNLRESERTLSTLMSNLPGMAYRATADPDMKVLFASEGCIKLTGYSPEELTGGNVSFTRTIIHPRDRQAVRHRVESAISSFRPFRLIYRILTRDRRTKWVWEQGQAVYNDAGEVERLDGFITDITERRQAEQALRNSERRLELVLEATSEGVWDWNVKTGEAHYSRRWIESLGYEPEDVPPHIDFWESIVHPEDRPMVEAALKDHFEGRTPVYQCENRLRMKNGSYRWNLDRGKVVRWDADDKPLRMVGTDTDITARKEAEQTKATLEAELRQAQKLEAVGTLASGIAHDFSNLLTALYGYIEDAREEVAEDHPARQTLAMIERVADEASGVTRSLLTFTHKSAVEKTAVNLADVVEGAFHLLRRVLPASVRIRTHLDQRDHVWTNGDAAQLQQIVMNLAINARDAMPDGGQLEITVRPTDAAPGEAELVEMIVTDTGVGMSDKVIARIFEPFFTTKARGKGTGLGLSIIHGIVTDHGGRVDVQSQPGKGTTFTLLFPACAAPPVSTKSKDKVVVPAGHDELILLAEDNDFVRELTITSLEQADYRVIGADNGQEIISALKKHLGDVRVVILDIDLPDMTGLNCLKALREIDTDLPAILVTGRIDHLSEESLPSGTWVLPKPFQMPMLVELIRSTLQSHTPAEAQP
ncbi:MAG: PAS domain S-box protein [Phycisphaera sp.]|nr:PAS domain S-box protein [Phycisphaera sp.]